MSATNHNIPTTARDIVRSTDRRLAHQESRPQVREAADIMGPGLGPFAVEIQDWSSDEALFNGILFSRPNALNSPNFAQWWIGTVWATDDGHGLQQIRQFQGGVQPRPEWLREFAPGGSGTSFGPWVAL